MAIEDVMAAVAGEKKEKKGEGKHYIPFSQKEWEELEAGFKRELEPKFLKLLIQSIAKGHVSLSLTDKGKAAAEAKKTAA